LNNWLITQQIWLWVSLLIAFSLSDSEAGPWGTTRILPWIACLLLLWNPEEIFLECLRFALVTWKSYQLLKSLIWLNTGHVTLSRKAFPLLRACIDCVLIINMTWQEIIPLTHMTNQCLFFNLIASKIILMTTTVFD